MWTFFFDNPEKFFAAKAVLVRMLSNREIDSMGVRGADLSLNVFTEEHAKAFIETLKNEGINHRSYIVVGPKSQGG